MNSRESAAAQGESVMAASLRPGNEKSDPPLRLRLSRYLSSAYFKVLADVGSRRDNKPKSSDCR
jgi:hypothetical protein